MMSDLDLSATQLRVGKHVLFTDLGSEAILLNLDTGRYFGLDQTGKRIWTLVAEHGQLEAVWNSMLAEFEVPTEKLRQDIVDFVSTLAAHNLLEFETT